MAKKKPTPLPEPSPKQSGLQLLLADELRLSEMREMAETGASIATIEARLRIPVGHLNRWLEKGRNPKFRKTYYARFFLEWRAWVSVARAAAESQQLVKAPSQWLERSSSSRKLDDPSENQVLIPASTASTLPNAFLQLGGQAALAALQVLRKSNISIDEQLDKGTLRIGSPLPTEPIPDEE